MKITDRVYGTHIIKSPVLIELIKSRSIQRLKKLNQYGIPDRYYHLINFSRYNRSVGVMLLLKILGASEEEQIAGLLHDASHTAFSHVIDWVLGDAAKEDYQDNAHGSYLSKTEIPDILSAHGYTIEQVIDYHNFTLLERPSPYVCADRIDNALRDSCVTKIKSITLINKSLLKNLLNMDKHIVFRNKKYARAFGLYYLHVHTYHWGGYEAVARYTILAQLLKHALSKKYILVTDIWQHDEWVIAKLLKTADPYILKGFSVLANKSLTQLPRSKERIIKKFRYVDPEYLANGQVVRLSQADKRFYEEIEIARKRNQEGIAVPNFSV